MTAIDRLHAGLEWMANYNLTGTERTLHIDFQGKARELLGDAAAVEALYQATDVPLFLACITDPPCGDCPGCNLAAARRRVGGE